MPARVLAPTPEGIAEAAEVIRRGGLVAFPTETVYGLGANALDETAARRIFEAKGRPADDPLIVHLADIDEIGRVAEEARHWRALAERFWPGPLTLVLPRREVVPLVVTAGGDTVAVRVPAHAVALALIRAAAVPIAAPSANLFARPSPTTAAHVLNDLADRIDLVLDGGPTEVGVESTVVDLTGEVPAVLRPGGVTIEELRKVVGLVDQPRTSQDPRSPGTAERHYSPRARLDLFEDAPLPHLRRALGLHVTRLRGQGAGVALMLFDDDLDPCGLPAVPLGPVDSPHVAARRLYAALRELDAGNPDVIIARLPSEGGIATALRDRLRRAANGRIVDARP